MENLQIVLNNNKYWSDIPVPINLDQSSKLPYHLSVKSTIFVLYVHGVGLTLVKRIKLNTIRLHQWVEIDHRHVGQV